MIDREELTNIKNILSLDNENNDISALYNILTAIKEDDSVAFIDAVYSASYSNIDITLLKDVYKVIKENQHLREDLLDSFSNNQMISKNALLDAIFNYTDINENSIVAIWGGWYGSILIPSLTNKVKRITTIDLDCVPLQIAKNRLFKKYNNIDYVCDDIFLSYRNSYIDTNLIINTSCEHMQPMKEWKWFGPGAIKGDSDTATFKTPKLNKNCWFAFQSNNMFGIEGHVNCVNSIEEFENQMPHRAEIVYREEVKDTRGTRFMLVGKFNAL